MAKLVKSLQEKGMQVYDMNSEPAATLAISKAAVELGMLDLVDPAKRTRFIAAAYDLTQYYTGFTLLPGTTIPQYVDSYMQGDKKYYLYQIPANTITLEVADPKASFSGEVFDTDKIMGELQEANISLNSQLFSGYKSHWGYDPDSGLV